MGDRLILKMADMKKQLSRSEVETTALLLNAGK